MSNPTIVLVHGAFAESASWNGVITRLADAGHATIAAPNHLRSLSADAESVRALLSSIEGPIVLAGHSYGGSVISNAAKGISAVKALVFVAGFAPMAGESIAELSGKYPGSTLGETLQPVPLRDGTTDLLIRQDRYHEQFAADLSAEDAAINAVTQRPLRDVALHEGASEPGWADIPSWIVIPGLDRNIPVAAQHFMAERANAQEVVEVPGASHAITVSRPDEVANTISRAIKATS